MTKKLESLDKILERLDTVAEGYKNHLAELNKYDPIVVSFAAWNQIGIVKEKMKERQDWFNEFYADHFNKEVAETPVMDLKKAQAILSMVLGCELSAFVESSVEDALEIIEKVLDNGSKNG